MSKATVEFDFFGMDKDNSAKSQFQKLFEQRRTVRGFRSAISKINPQLLKTVIASGAASGNKMLKLPENGVGPSTLKGNQNLAQTLPVCNPIFRHSSERLPETAPLTIFYNGMVSVFDLPHVKAEKVMNLAMEGNSKTVEPAESKLKRSLSSEYQLIETLNGDLPIARKKSLQRFLEKRKERLTSTSPYSYPRDGMADKKSDD